MLFSWISPHLLKNRCNQCWMHVCHSFSCKLASTIMCCTAETVMPWVPEIVQNGNSTSPINILYTHLWIRNTNRKLPLGQTSDTKGLVGSTVKNDFKKVAPCVQPAAQKPNCHKKWQRKAANPLQLLHPPPHGGQTTRPKEMVPVYHSGMMHMRNNVFPTDVGVRQEKQILDDLDQCAQLSVFLRGVQPHQEFLQPFLQLLSVNHGLWNTVFQLTAWRAFRSNGPVP